MLTRESSSQEILLSSVIGRGLCSGCTACVGLCPYWRRHGTRQVAVFECDLTGGRCARYCPRVPTEWSAVQRALFDEKTLTAELGPFRGLYITRAADPELRERAQHGGTVSALAALALEEGVVDSWVLSAVGKNHLPESFLASTREEVLLGAGSKFVMSPVVAEFNRASRESGGSFGVVATPCQALALAKMRADPDERDRERLARLKLVIGLFCGWTLDWEKLKALLTARAGGREVLAVDVPPSGHACMEVTTPEGVIEIPIAEVNECVREACGYCGDMTSEFADLSVGSARSGEGWAVDRGWNQVIVRSEAGERLLALARERGVLEFREVPEANLPKLRAASLAKKRKCVVNLGKFPLGEEAPCLCPGQKAATGAVEGALPTEGVTGGLGCRR